MPLSVIGAGFGRTGTMSLQTALEEIGFKRCYHMREVREHPEHAALWSAAAAGEDVDWEVLFEGYLAAVDWPTCHFWRRLSARYPEAKVILTRRDPARWYDSVTKTIYLAMTGGIPDDDPAVLERRRMARNIILERTFGGRFEDRAHAIAVYEEHQAEVRAEIAPERLLVYEVRDGWEPLCEFLGRPVPDTPFPNINSTTEFRANAGLDEG
ncbi:MAG: sulfotransferase [Alphaproteobacteria bacterium]|jgi:hypothetical protein|nr:sulfotransferase [Alphaproteobacteria bacterium]